MKLNKLLILIQLICAYSFSFGAANIKTASNVDAARFLGTWYRIAANPIIFEPSCVCARQVLNMQSNGKIGVYNSCNKKDTTGKLVEIRGTAQPKDASVSKLSVDFGLPWKGSYWIIAVDQDYRWAVVSDSLGYSLYVMSKTIDLSPEQYQEAISAAMANNVSVKRLKIQSQAGCVYPPER